MLEFARFDRRRYPTVSVQEGYRDWRASYETTVEDDMDVALLTAIESVPWGSVRRAVDLGCGTGRTGAWLRARGVGSVAGVDVTPEMLAAARARGIYARLDQADVRATGLPGRAYDLATTSLVDEHLPDLRPLYREAARLLEPSGFYVLVGYHPHFSLLEMHERLVDDRWIALKPRWEPYRNHPVSFAMAWRSRACEGGEP